jgi:hypothetical protein
VELVLPAAGIPSKIIAKRLWYMEATVHYLDLGSIVDALEEKPVSRKWLRLKGHVINNVLRPESRRTDLGFKLLCCRKKSSLTCGKVPGCCREGLNGMKVLQLSCRPIWQGAEQQIAYLIKGLRAKAIECFVVFRKRSLLEGYCQKKDIPHFSLPFANEMDLWTAYRAAGFFRKNQIDILHTHRGHALAIGVWANILGAPTRHIYNRRVL